MTDSSSAPKRIILKKEELEKLSKEELISRWLEQDEYITSVLSGQSGGGAELTRLQESEDTLRKQIQEASRRENVLVMRLTTKEQEMQDCLNQIEELKRSQTPSSTQLKGMLLDPAVNLMFQRMRKEMEICKEKLEQAQNDLAAWKFTPDGQTGKRLMAKCRMLLQENEELGKVISSGRTAKLEAEIALQKKFVEEMKSSQAETDDFLVEIDEDVEGMQGTILALQQQLKDTKEQLAALQHQYNCLLAAQVKTEQQTVSGVGRTGVELPIGISIKSEPGLEDGHSNGQQHETMDTSEIGGKWVKDRGYKRRHNSRDSSLSSDDDERQHSRNSSVSRGRGKTDNMSPSSESFHRNGLQTTDSVDEDSSSNF